MYGLILSWFLMYQFENTSFFESGLPCFPPHFSLNNFSCPDESTYVYMYSIMTCCMNLFRGRQWPQLRREVFVTRPRWADNCILEKMNTFGQHTSKPFLFTDLVYDCSMSRKKHNAINIEDKKQKNDFA